MSVISVETKQLRQLAGATGLVDTDLLYVELTNGGSKKMTYEAPENGFIIGSGYGSGQQTSYIYISMNGVSYKAQGVSDENISVMFPVSAGNRMSLEVYLSIRNDGIYFVPLM